MRKELVALREAMARYGIDLYIIPTGDFHGSEYINDYFKTRKYVSGFTGSAGTLVVAQDEARLWTDGRYFLQAATELEGSGIDLMKDKEPGVPSIKEYLEEKLESIATEKTQAAQKRGEYNKHSDLSSFGPVLGFDGRTMPFTAGAVYEELVANINGRIISDFDLAGEIWPDRPALQGKEIWQLPLSYAGLPYETKIAQVRDLMEKAGADYHLITTLDDNAWLYNLRGSDVEHTPVFFSYTLITPEETILYIFDEMCPKDIIPEGVTVKSYFSSSDILNICLDVEKIPSGANMLVDGNAVPYKFLELLPDDVNLITQDSIPSARLKAVKNEVEIEATTEAHINDGIAMVNFIYWLKENIKKESTGPFEVGAPVSDPMTEIGASDYLEAQRRALPGFIDISFDTIAGYMAHGSIVHYSATPETNAKLRPEGFLLVDSGGQYMTGTTDITRTIALGPLTDRMKECYTAVLKGHLQLALANFQEGTVGKDLDPIAKAPLTEIGISYNHGTGHGVGHVLCVHEGPQRINDFSEEQFIPGMITSDEPGYYPEGEYGIRIEGELLCVPDDDEPGYYRFNMLTCCPYEREAIVKSMLTLEELTFVNIYHNWVYSMLESEVTPEVAAWLEEACAPL